MITAYILAKMDIGKEDEVFEKIRALSEIKKAAATYGTYDMIVETAFESIEEMDEFIFTKLRKIPGITKTVSIITSKPIV